MGHKIYGCSLKNDQMVIKIHKLALQTEIKKIMLSYAITYAVTVLSTFWDKCIMGIIMCKSDFDFHLVVLCFVLKSSNVKTIAADNVSR